MACSTLTKLCTGPSVRVQSLVTGPEGDPVPTAVAPPALPPRTPLLRAVSWTCLFRTSPVNGAVSTQPLASAQRRVSGASGGPRPPRVRGAVRGGRTAFCAPVGCGRTPVAGNGLRRRPQPGLGSCGCTCGPGLLGRLLVCQCRSDKARSPRRQRWWDGRPRCPGEVGACPSGDTGSPSGRWGPEATRQVHQGPRGRAGAWLGRPGALRARWLWRRSWFPCVEGSEPKAAAWEGA